MKTIPRRYHGEAPAGECRKSCDYCGMTWMRSVMRRDAAGLLRCPDCADGRDTVTCDRDNQAAAEASAAWRASRAARRLD